jgi:hypothetical protein
MLTNREWARETRDREPLCFSKAASIRREASGSADPRAAERAIHLAHPARANRRHDFVRPQPGPRGEIHVCRKHTAARATARPEIASLFVFRQNSRVTTRVYLVRHGSTEGFHSARSFGKRGSARTGAHFGCRRSPSALTEVGIRDTCLSVLIASAESPTTA